MKPARRLLPEDEQRMERVLKLLYNGDPQQALRELQGLTRGGWKHPWTEVVMWRTAQQVELKTNYLGRGGVADHQ